MLSFLTKISAFAIAISMPSLAVAELNKVSSKSEFLEIVDGKRLTIFAINVSVTPDGSIGGRAYGQNVRGKWQWQDGYFCRDLFWGEKNLGPNCQEVRVNGDVIRFTYDRGAGRYADLKMR